MRLFCFLSITMFLGCGNPDAGKNQKAVPVQSFKEFTEAYYREWLRFNPLEATLFGENDFNDQLALTVTEAYRSELRAFYTRMQSALAAYDPAGMDDNDRASRDILQWECDVNLKALSFPDHYLPINQFWSLPLSFGQYGSGSGPQPFKTVQDYDKWLRRVDLFAVWCDSALVSMRKGLEQGYTLPRSLVVKVIPQYKEVVAADPAKSLYYGPVAQIPADFPDTEKTRLKEAFTRAIAEKLNPAFQKLADFFEKEHLPKARATSGISELPKGRERYEAFSQFWTTTTMTPEEIFALGEREVARIRSEMEKVKAEVGFNGDLRAFFDFVRTDKRFMPYKTPEAVLQWYAGLEKTMQPSLGKMFDLTPKSKFEVRRTEAFREASASAEYVQAAPDGSRPGIFYVPLPDASKHNVVGGEALFLHEAIPGHHYQTSLQMENTALPAFRRSLWYGAYGEGWALYTESLGKELGLYTDPYQYFGMLSSEMHRAIRLVVDVGLHVKGWTREQAIEYSKANEAEPEESIVSEIERYMAVPGQALSYKVGQLKILELRKRAEDKLGARFDIKAFHNQLLDAGCLPLKVLEEKVDRWIAGVK